MRTGAHASRGVRRKADPPKGRSPGCGDGRRGRASQDRHIEVEPFEVRGFPVVDHRIADAFAMMAASVPDVNQLSEAITL